MSARGKQIFRIAGQTLLINQAATLVAVGLSVYPDGWHHAFTLQNVFSSFIYANSIGTLIGLTFYLLGFPGRQGSSGFVQFIRITPMIFATTLLGATVAEAVLSTLGFSSWSDVFPPQPGTFVFSLIIAFIFGFSAFFYQSSKARLVSAEEDLRRQKTAEADARALATQAQLASLESRIHPHFLFNTLNSIASLVRENPPLAERMIERLSTLLRYSLDSNAHNLVSLGQELKITTDYLEIEKARFGPRLFYRIECDNSLLDAKLPPLALQTLVENSVKHVAAKRSIATEIIVSIVEENDGFLKIEVKDNGPGFSDWDFKSGHGLDILQKRLETIFACDARLEVPDGLGDGRVTLIIPYDGKTS